MLNFSPTEEQEEIRRLAHSLATEQLRPQARAAEKSGDISSVLMETLAQTGLTTPFPEDYGGNGNIEAVAYTLIAEELGFGNASQQEQYIFPFCNGRDGSTERGSLAYAERTGGYSLADISTTARRDGDQYVLNGTKRDVIHGGKSRPCVVLARLEGSNELCGFVLPDQLAGVRVVEDVQKLGLIAAPSASYVFENAVVPASALLGEPGNAGIVRAAALYALLRAAVACGTARAALEYAGSYAEERIAFGRPIVSYQGIAFMIAEIAMKLDGVRLLVWSAAADWDRSVELETLTRDAEAAQFQAIKIAQSATIDAVQIMGGAGFMQDHPVEMWMRNAAAME